MLVLGRPPVDILLAAADFDAFKMAGAVKMSLTQPLSPVLAARARPRPRGPRGWAPESARPPRVIARAEGETKTNRASEKILEHDQRANVEESQRRAADGGETRPANAVTIRSPRGDRGSARFAAASITSFGCVGNADGSLVTRAASTGRRMAWWISFSKAWASPVAIRPREGTFSSSRRWRAGWAPSTSS